MEELGLPMAFGKQTAKPASLPRKPPPPTQTRGEPGQRGSRGVVGGSKRRRGRGGHIPYNASGANAQPVSSRGEGVNREPSENTGAGHGDTDNASTADELNPGVKVSFLACLLASQISRASHLRVCLVFRVTATSSWALWACRAHTRCWPRRTVAPVDICVISAPHECLEPASSLPRGKAEAARDWPAARSVRSALTR